MKRGKEHNYNNESFNTWEVLNTIVLQAPI